jgi:hypothetical protein
MIEKKKKICSSSVTPTINFLIKLANDLDSKGLSKVADLTDQIILKLAQSFFEDDDKSSNPRDRITPESNEILETLKDSELPTVMPYKEKNLFLIKGVFKDGTKAVINLDKETIDFMNRYLSATKGTGIEIKIPSQGPYTFKEVQPITELILMFYTINPGVNIDSATSELMVEKMMNMSPEEISSAGELDHLEIFRFNTIKSFSGEDPSDELVATVDLDGNIQYLISPEKINSPNPLEVLVKKEPKQRNDELRTVVKENHLPYDVDSEYGQNLKQKREKAIQDHGDRWKRRYEESAQRYIDKRYPEDEYSGTKTEVPYGTEIDEFEDSEENLPFM